MENKDGLITCYINLNVQTKGICRDICFLITNIGHEDIILRYPWLSTFEPQFDWTHAVIHEKALPIVIQSVNPCIPRKDPVIAKTMNQETEYIWALWEHTLRATTATDLAVAVQQYTTKATILPEYQEYKKVFRKEESKQYPTK